MSRFGGLNLFSLAAAALVGLFVAQPWCTALLVGVLLLYLLVLGLGVTVPRLQLFGPVLCRAHRAGKRVFLSFDDGPDPDVTPRVLEVLAELEVPATFFCVGNKLQAHPELARNIVAAGHAPGNHSQRHAWWGNFRLRSFWRREILSAQRSWHQACGQVPRVFRSPMGLSQPHLAGALRDTGLVHVGWDCGGRDRGKTPEQVIARIVAQAQPGSVILLHDGMQDPAAAAHILRGVVEGLRARGLSFGALGELLAEHNRAREGAARAAAASALALLLYGLTGLPWLLLWPLARLCRCTYAWGDLWRRAWARQWLRLFPSGRWREQRPRQLPAPCLLLAAHTSLPAQLLSLARLPRARWWGPRARGVPGAGCLPDLEAVRAALARGRRVLVWPDAKGRLPEGLEALLAEGTPGWGVRLTGTRPSEKGLARPDWQLQLMPLTDLQSLDGRDSGHEPPPAAGSIVRSRHLGRPLRWAAFAALALLSLGLGLHIYAQRFCLARPPKYSGDRSLAKHEPHLDGHVQTLGRHWRRERRGVHELGLVGSPWERGYANARLCRDLLQKQEEVLLELAERFVPNPVAMWLLVTALTINNQSLPDFLSAAERLEVLGLVDGSVDHHPELGPLYHRVLNYHAAHDISHLLIDNPLIAQRELIGCSAFAAWGEATEAGRLLVGRNFDFEGGEVFDSDKVILYVWPEGGVPYVHVAWAGMAGAVTGLNQAGIAVSINAGRTADLRRVGTPTTMVVRRVLESAHSIAEAVAIIESAEIFVSDSFLIASRDEGRAVVVEKSPARQAVREAVGPRILQTNHYLSPAFADDPVNQAQLEGATTGFRYRRLESLLAASDPLVPARCLAILRDTSVEGAREGPGLGNRNSLNALIACHSVVMDLDAGRMWVSSGPQTVGSYLAVDVYASLERGPERALQRAPVLDDDLPADLSVLPRYPAYLAWKQTLQAGHRALQAADIEGARTNFVKLERLNPGAFQNALMTARLAEADGLWLKARVFYQHALNRLPPFASLRAEINADRLRCRAVLKAQNAE